MNKSLNLVLFAANAVLTGINVSHQNYGVATFSGLVAIMCLFAAYERP